MSRRWLAVAVLLQLGCSTLPVTGDGVVALEIRLPASLSLREGETVLLVARALDQQGSEVTAAIRWRTPDAGVAVDSVTGLVTAIAPAGTGRVQAVLGTLRSDLITFTLLPAPPQGP